MKKKKDFKTLKKIIPYLLSGILLLSLIFLGTLSKKNTSTTLNFNALTHNVSADKVSELYVVANSSSALHLTNANTAADNYVTTMTMYKAGQSTTITTGGIDKPTMLDTPYTRGVTSILVAEGDTMSKIASEKGLTTDQIRWSNNLISTNINRGDTLYIPSVPGIVYTVKDKDTIESIAKKCKASAQDITFYNDLENTNLVAGLKIVIKDGVLPENERPEYVPIRTYTYSGQSGTRINQRQIGTRYSADGGYAPGHCTSYAWYKRQDLPKGLGNANNWAREAARQGFPVDKYPRPGDIFQTSAGPYGHVGYVEEVYADGSLLVTEMNYGSLYGDGIIREAIVPTQTAQLFNFIHRK